MLKFLLSRIPTEVARPKILLIDDDRDIRTITTLVLMTSGFGDILEAATAEEGLRMAREERPNLILLDFKLPDMNGETALHLIKADPWTRDIPVVFFTAHATERHLLEAMPVAGIVLKPFHPHQLCDTVRAAIQRNHAAGMPSLSAAAHPVQTRNAQQAVAH